MNALCTRRSVVGGLIASGCLPLVARARRPRQRVIVVGAGFGGATCAIWLQRLAPTTEVLLFDQRARFLTGPFTNLVVAGLRTERSITRQVTAIAHQAGIRPHVSLVTEIDPQRRGVRTADGQRFEADRLVVAPGIQMKWGAIEGLTAASSARMPHAWLGDAQVMQLHDRLQSVPDGGVVLIGAPPNPYRCPPGPYERASLMAHALARSGRGRVKVIVADAKDDFSKSGLFRLEWDLLYPGVIEWLARKDGGEVVRVDPESGEVWLRNSGEPIRASLASIIPPQQAAELALRSDLADDSGWCPVHPHNFESRRHAGVHVIGDAAIATPMPKSAFAANSQAKLCASAIAAELNRTAPPDPKLLNTCYSMVSAQHAISISAYYGVSNDALYAISEGMSPLSGDDALRAREGRQALAWYDSITRDSFGPQA